MMSEDIFLWWLFLCLVGGVNIAAWSVTAAALKRRHGTLPGETYTARRLQLFLAAGYVLGCAFRSVVLVYDVPRVCLFDSWLCSVLIGRSVATIAELCFVIQLALMLRELSGVKESITGRVVAAVIIPLIVVAEICSWYSVLTTSNLGHVFEESLWGVSAALIVLSLVAIWPRCDALLRRLVVIACVAGTAYVAFMLLIDVPMYWTRWVADEANGRAYLSIAQGAQDVAGHWVVSHKWDVWRHEVPWMSLYFSVAVWLSIALVHVPVLQRGRTQRPSRVISRAPLGVAR
jgi:hypothetical protein